MLFGALLASTSLVSPTHAQSADALIDKLVQKGVLTTEEAKNLRDEAKSDATKPSVVKSPFPDWVTSWKLNGDFRGRFERHSAENDLFSNRDRFRYRLRLGTTVGILNDFEIGLRLASANPAPGGIGFGGNPVSANTDLSDGASRKFIFLDAAYAKWTPIHSDAWMVSGTFGKMDQAFALSPMVFDADYQPEGGTLQAVWKLNQAHALRFTSAMFVLDEFNQGASASHDPYLYGGQVVWESAWTPRIGTAVGLAAFSVVNKDNLLNPAAPNANSGNTRAATGAPMHNFNPIIASGSVSYQLDSFPLYQGAFPIKLVGEYLDNPAAPSNNRGWGGGLTLGKTGQKGLWELSYKYQRLEADAWYEELPDDDNGGFYAGAPANSGLGVGYFGGTNVKGHIIKGSYAFNKSLTFSITYYLTELIQPTVGADGSTLSNAGHLLADLMWRF